MEVHRLPGLCEERHVTLALFSRVRNSGQLRSLATSGTLQAALLEPTLIASSFHVLCAVYKAVIASERGQMKTRNVFSEIIFSLSPSTNISDSFKKYGIKDSSQNVLLVTLHSTKEDPQVTEMCGLVEGDLVPLDQISIYHSKESIVKECKIPAEEIKISALENSVVTRLCGKDEWKIPAEEIKISALETL